MRDDSSVWVRWRRGAAYVLGVVVLAVCALLFIMMYSESRSSAFQAGYFSSIVREATFALEDGPARALRLPGAGPYDTRLGYNRIMDYVQRLGAREFEVSAQARQSTRLAEVMDRGLFPPYSEKSQAGLQVFDCCGDPIYSARHPRDQFASYVEIPSIIVEALLFIENRELLDPERPKLNPAIEWDRLYRAAYDQILKMVWPGHSSSGGSTLATQIEKFRHSPSGVTTGPAEKLRQMLSASLRAYRDGEETLAARRRIVLDYVNSVPLAAVPAHGEVIGLGDGLRIWFGADPQRAAQSLRLPELDRTGLEEKGRALRQVISLLVAQRRPSYLLNSGEKALASLTESYVRLIAQAGIISPSLRDAALGIETPLRRQDMAGDGGVESSFVRRKAANAIRYELMQWLGEPGVYELDRLDLTVRSSLHRRAQEDVTALLRQLADPQFLRVEGFYGKHLLQASDDPSKILVSFTLFERMPDGNMVRVQADNLDRPLDINEGTKLDLGSSAKLRTLATYLEITAAIHRQLADVPSKDLMRMLSAAEDRLTRWVMEYLSTAKDRSLAATLEAAMQRRYSASPHEVFFTGGGLHTFENFDSESNEWKPTVASAFNQSINLPFIRLMRDIVQHYMHRPGGVAEIFRDPEDPRRQDYLERFVDEESRRYLLRFWKRYRGKGESERFDTLLDHVSAQPHRIATVFRSVYPEADWPRFAWVMTDLMPELAEDPVALQELFVKYGSERYTLSDRGYLARVHPLELWLLSYLRERPAATYDEAVEASARERRDAYAWLFKTRHKGAQDVRIRSLLEGEAFAQLAREWQRLGYPFETLIPSYATAIGSSADRPAALAELMGIILNDGVRVPTVRIERLDFAAGTPFETQLVRRRSGGEQVMLPEVARALRNALVGVVERGTARRIAGYFAGRDGRRLPLGGKTGTGDHRRERYNRWGNVISSKAMNRAATFVFFLGDRHFGNVTAFVPGSDSGDYRFTSALAVQVLKALSPALAPLVQSPPARLPTARQRTDEDAERIAAVTPGVSAPVQ